MGLRLVLALVIALPQEAPREVVVRAAAPDVVLPAGASVRSIVFAADLDVAGSVTAPSLALLPDSRIVYERSAGVANQRVTAELEVLGNAAFVNDNPWTHMAHMLLVEGRLVSSCSITVAGAGAGGVRFGADSRGSFSGVIHVAGGNLLVGHAGALGSTDAPTRLRGGRLSLYSGETAEPLVFAGDAALHTGVGVTLRGDLTVLAGATAQIDTGGGNPGRLLGALRGEGALVVRGGGRNTAQALTPFTLGGDAPTTLRGPLTVARGTLALAKPAGVTAVAGELRLGGGSNLAAVRLDADEQIADDAPLVTLGDERAMLWSDGHAETLGVLRLGSDVILRMGEGADRVRFAASAGEAWRAGRELVVERWEGAPGGGGEDRVVFGATADGLAPAQVAAAGFRDPAGRAPGLYAARLAADGELLPERAVVPRADNAFALGEGPDAARASLYQVDGLARLAGPGSPLPDGAAVSFFGDSITWQHGYLGHLERALAAGAGPRDVTLRNRGINGGGARDLQGGSPRSARAGGRPGGDADAPQEPFAQVLAADRPRAVVIFIGVNDVNWRGTTPGEFTEALAALVRSARAASAEVVLATLFLGGERPDGTNDRDAALERFAELTRSVAKAEGATLVDLRRAALAWLRNHNRRLRLDGTLEFDDLGLLTYDGIHPTDAGNALIAELVADGICRALAR